ncbi:MAG: hypothetical protein CMI00_11330 [Oceanospirillaceae bacterium]|nr:hypothetical protein [Oceanospirillaceae bacterium]|tara:strand:- start:443 stop:1045 length:603 start_codon:yes stop_codon:yes gene_type:complete
MFAEMQPLYWRIQNKDASGFDAVSLLMPSADGEPATLFPTDVSFCSRRSGTQSVDLRWSDDDSDLFMTLLDRVEIPEADEEDDGLVLDINDGVVQGIVQLVALARFKTPWPTDELVAEDINTEREELELGDLAAVNTIHGYATAIVVAMDSIDITCVLLEDICDDHNILVPHHSLVVVNRISMLPLAFAESDIGEGAVRH